MNQDKARRIGMFAAYNINELHDVSGCEKEEKTAEDDETCQRGKRKGQGSTGAALYAKSGQTEGEQ